MKRSIFAVVLGCAVTAPLAAQDIWPPAKQKESEFTRRKVGGGSRVTEACTKINYRFVNRLLRGCGPKVELVSCGFALEALESALGQIGRENAAFRLNGFVQRTGATYLVPEQVQHIARGHDAPQLSSAAASDS